MDTFQADSKEEIFIEGLPLSILSDSPLWIQECHKFFLCIAQSWCPGQNHRKPQKTLLWFLAEQLVSLLGEGLSSVLNKVCHSLVQAESRKHPRKDFTISLGGKLKLLCYPVGKKSFPTSQFELLLFKVAPCFHDLPQTRVHLLPSRSYRLL